MRHPKTILLLVVAVLAFVVPQFMLATESAGQWPQWAHNMIGITSLAIAVALMIDVLALHRVSEGSAISENINYLVLGVICLAASVLFGWIGGLLPLGISSDQAVLASDGFVMLAMAFMAIYFYRLYTSLSGYIKSAQAYADSLASTDAEEE
jgi:hypothetical protein